MDGSTEELVEAAAKIFREGDITLDDIKRLGSTLSRERMGYIGIVDPEWEGLQSGKKEPAKPPPEPVTPDIKPETDSSEKQPKQDLDDAKSKELMDHLLSVALGEEKKPRKSKKVMAREKLVREVKAMQQKEKDKSGKGGASAGKGSSSEEEQNGKGLMKKEAVASQKGNGNGEREGGIKTDSGKGKLKTVVKITAKRQVLASKSGEKQPSQTMALPEKKDSTKEEVADSSQEKALEDGRDEEVGETQAVFFGRLLGFPTFLRKYEESKGWEPTGLPTLSYKVLLRCMSRGTEETRDLELWKTPKTGADIRGRIERAFQIPRSFQGDLNFNGKTIDEGTSLARLGLRLGAMMEMKYLCEAQVEEVRIVVEWFRFMSRFSGFYHYSVFGGYPMEFNVVAVQGINGCIPRLMADEYLYPPDDKTKYANRVYFLQQNGHLLLLELYENVLLHSWRTLWLPFKFAETDCMYVLAALGCGHETRKILVKNDAHGYVLQSLLRVPVSRFKPLEDTSGAPGDAEQKNYILKCLLECAVKFLFNFRDNSEVHMDICSRSSAVDQLIAIAHCTSFSVEVAQDCMCVFACCMHSPDAHKYLCRNPTLEGIVDCVNSHRSKGECSEAQLKLLHYYTQVTLSHLVMSSGSHMSIKAINKIVTFMTDYLKDLDPMEVYDLEQQRHQAASWSVFFPHIKPLLSPPLKVDRARCSVDQTLQSALYEHSLETMLFALQVMCTGDPNDARRDLMDEKLLGYVFCLPSNVPAQLQERARNLCSVLHKDSVPPPKLNVIARAKLAVMSIGLKKAMDRNAKDLKLELSPTPRTLRRFPFLMM